MSDAPLTKLDLILPLTEVPLLEDTIQGLDLDSPPTMTHFEIEETPHLWQFEAFFEVAPDRAQIEAALQTALGRIPDYHLDVVEQKDWVSESLRLLAPVRAGRFFVHGRHDADKIPAGTIPLEIEAGQAFGSGNHATTQGCLLAIDRLVHEMTPARALDLGCGSGILAIAMAKVWPQTRVVATDIDPIAVMVTRENAELHQVTLVSQTCDGMDDPIIQADVPFDVIVANILMQPLIDLAPAVVAALAPSGIIVLSGLLETQQAAVEAAYRQQGMMLGQAIHRDGWAALVLRR